MKVTCTGLEELTSHSLQSPGTRLLPLQILPRSIAWLSLDLVLEQLSPSLNKRICGNRVIVVPTQRMSQFAICKEGERRGSSIRDPLPENEFHHWF